jgi:hypothetical protein
MGLLGVLLAPWRRWSGWPSAVGRAAEHRFDCRNGNIAAPQALYWQAIGFQY